jgi:polyphosphate kinase
MKWGNQIMDSAVAEHHEPTPEAKENVPPLEELLASPERFMNRELSWLQFNRRVMEEASNRQHPLLEQLRFLSISAANLDEFFMVRVAGLREQLKAGVVTKSQDGLTPAEQLAELQGGLGADGDQQARWPSCSAICHEKIHPARSRRGSRNGSGWRIISSTTIFPVLTPLAIDPAHPFPFIPNLGFTLGAGAGQHQRRPRQLDALIRLPIKMDRFIEVPDLGRRRAAPLHHAGGCGLALHRQALPGLRRQGTGSFRIIRDSDLEVEEEAEDLVRVFETMLKQRRRGVVIRIEVEPACRRICAKLRAERAQGRPRRDRRRRRHDRPARALAARRLERRISSSSPTMRAFPSASASMAAIASRRSARRT